MSAGLLAGVLTSAVLVSLPGGLRAVSEPGTSLRLAVLPCTNIEITFRKFYPLLAHLKSRTGYTVTLVVPADLSQLETDAAYGRIDFVLQDPHTYQLVSHLFDEGSLLQVRSLDGTTAQSGVLVAAPEQLVAAIRKVSRGGRYVSEALGEQLAFLLGSATDQQPHEIVSDREFHVMLMLASGKTTSEVADTLCLSVKTVSTYRSRALRKMNMKTNAELSFYAVKHGLLG